MDELIGVIAEMRHHANFMETERQRNVEPSVLKLEEQHMDRLMVRLVRLGTDQYYRARFTDEAIARTVEQGVRVFMEHRGLF